MQAPVATMPADPELADHLPERNPFPSPQLARYGLIRRRGLQPWSIVTTGFPAIDPANATVPLAAARIGSPDWAAISMPR